MGDAVTLVIEVDLSCRRCRKRIEEYLCRVQCKYRIQEIIYVEEKNIVRVTGLFCAEELKKKLYCKFRKIITNITVECKAIIELTKRINVCIEEHADIKKKIELLRKECVEICQKICGEICIGACEAICKKRCEMICKGECEVQCKEICEKKCCEKKCTGKCEKVCCEKKCKDSCEEVCCEKKCKDKCGKVCCGTKCKEKCDDGCERKPCKVQCRLQCQCRFKCRCVGICTCVCTCVVTYTETTICCANPCPCFVPSCNNYRCCSCGVIGRPPWYDGGYGFCNPSPCGYKPNCTPGRAPNCTPGRGQLPMYVPPPFVYETSSQNCSIM